jgi:two-component system NtrC family sensor kinase
MLEELTLIADETARCGAIVKNLLLFSKQQVGDQQKADLRPVVQRSLKLIEHHLKMHSIQLDLELDPEPVPLLCDPSQIEQALLALSINAVEAMTEGGTLSIVLRHHAKDHVVELVVRDAGCGIAETDIPRIFEPFFTTKERGKGTGLGLAVVHGIVQRHNGTIRVHSERNKGTTFTITFPSAGPVRTVAEKDGSFEHTG